MVLLDIEINSISEIPQDWLNPYIVEQFIHTEISEKISLAFWSNVK